MEGPGPEAAGPWGGGIRRESTASDDDLPPPWLMGIEVEVKLELLIPENQSPIFKVFTWNVYKQRR